MVDGPYGFSELADKTVPKQTYDDCTITYNYFESCDFTSILLSRYST